MSWTAIPTACAGHHCAPPFSFFFDIVGRYSAASGRPNPPLHRVCTLARKQGATGLVIECVLNRSDVRTEIDELDAACGHGGAAQAIAFSFFRNDADLSCPCTLKSPDFIGQAVLINYKKPGTNEFSYSYIYEAIFSQPEITHTNGYSSKLLNNFVHSDRTFVCKVKNKNIEIDGVYYCQQNGLTNVCAHASIRMIINTALNGVTTVTAAQINSFLNIKLPCQGLQIGQIEDVIRHFTGMEVHVQDCTNIPNEYLSILVSIIESGDLALLVFATGHKSATGSPVEHVVPVFGYTRNSDEWHPEALPAYRGAPSAPYYPSSAWIDHFLIHDDNFGPYFTLSSRTLEVDQDITPHWIITMRPSIPKVMSQAAETLGGMLLANLPLIAKSIPHSNRWLDYIISHDVRHVLRTIWMDKQSYLDHLTALRGHDGTQLKSGQLQFFAALPDRFWVVEFSPPALYTGNRSKLGEVLVSSTNLKADAPFDSVLGMRLPGSLLIRQGNSFSMAASGLASHAPLYQHREHQHQW